MVTKMSTFFVPSLWLAPQLAGSATHASVCVSDEYPPLGCTVTTACLPNSAFSGWNQPTEPSPCPTLDKLRDCFLARGGRLLGRRWLEGWGEYRCRSIHPTMDCHQQPSRQEHQAPLPLPLPQQPPRASPQELSQGWGDVYGGWTRQEVTKETWEHFLATTDNSSTWHCWPSVLRSGYSGLKTFI